MSVVQNQIAAVFPSEASLQAAIDQLEVAGLDRAQLGVLAPQAGAASGETADQLAADPHPPTCEVRDTESRGALAGALAGGLLYLGAVGAAGAIVLTGGGLGVALAALVGVGGAGGLVTGLAALGFHKEHAALIDAQLASGGLVLWVQPRDSAQAQTVDEVLKSAGAEKIVAHPAG